jgi:hypothetical protein
MGNSASAFMRSIEASSLKQVPVTMPNDRCVAADFAEFERSQYARQCGRAGGFGKDSFNS